MTKILEMRDIRKSFGSVHALRGVDFSLERGEITALLGDNGAGKSTLIKIISGLYAPTSGTVEINGGRVTRRTRAASASRRSIRTGRSASRSRSGAISSLGGTSRRASASSTRSANARRRRRLFRVSASRARGYRQTLRRRRSRAASVRGSRSGARCISRRARSS